MKGRDPALAAGIRRAEPGGDRVLSGSGPALCRGWLRRDRGRRSGAVDALSLAAGRAGADCGRGCGAGIRKTLLCAGFFIYGEIWCAHFHTGRGSCVFLSSRRKEPKAARGKIKQIFPRTPRRPYLSGSGCIGDVSVAMDCLNETASGGEVGRSPTNAAHCLQ